jgi:osmotically-inducible protein OsmY
MKVRVTDRLKKRILAFVSCLALLTFMAPSGRLWAQSGDMKDTDITAAIEGEFWTDQAVPSNQINVETSNGIVTLSGTAGNILAKERAARIAEAIVGVRAVINRIEVRPTVSRTDSELRTAVWKALIADPATESYQVEVKVDNGVVTLTGTVDSWQEKRLSATVAKGVAGVRGVNNRIDIDYKVNRSDYEVEQEAKQRLANDVRVDDALIDVEVENQKVILSGTVGSAQEKRQARIDAWVGGVNNVSAEGLKIQWWARDRMRRTNRFTSRTDSQIEGAIKDAFVYDPRLVSFNVDVDVADGGTVLSGVVNNLQAKKAAEEDAKNTVGVTYVDNNIKVRPKVIPTNEELENRVETALLRDPYVERFDLTVSASSGTVYLSGDVDTSWEKTQAARIAAGVKGATKVVNNISYEYEWVWEPDPQIRQDVQDQLWWSPFVDSDDVDLEVDNGVVTLTGTVDTYGERQAAEDNAYEGGAKDVVNNLMVTYRYQSPYDHETFNWPYYGAP